MRGVNKRISLIGSKILAIASAILAIVMVSYSGYVIYDSIYTNRSAFSSYDLSEYRPSLDDNGRITFEELQKINPDTVGWITIQGTNIDYPVVQGKDDLEYASKDVFGKASLSGSIYLTAANTRDFTNSFNLLYGHHMENGAMFGDIEKYEDSDFFHSHQDGILVTTLGTYDLKIFGRISTDAYDSKIYTAGDHKSSDFPDFLLYVQSLAVQWEKGTDVYAITEHIQTYLTAREKNIAKYGHFDFTKMPTKAIQNGMQLLALSTCADATTNGRQLLFATMKMRTEPLPAEMIGDNAVPLSPWGHGSAEYWSLLNLICVVMCVLICVPGIRGFVKKIRRIRGKVEADENPEEVITGKKALLGLLVEAGITVGTIILFILVNNLHKPMTLVDKYTPLMILLFAGVWFVDVWIFHRKKRMMEAQSKGDQEPVW